MGNNQSILSDGMDHLSNKMCVPNIIIWVKAHLCVFVIRILIKKLKHENNRTSLNAHDKAKFIVIYINVSRKIL